MARFVPCHFMDGVMDGVEVQRFEIFYLSGSFLHYESRFMSHIELYDAEKT